MTQKALDNCNITPQCDKCKKYTEEYIERFNWRCDKTCSLFYSDPRFPEGYSEMDYKDREDAEAIDGMRFDDMNFLRHFER